MNEPSLGYILEDFRRTLETFVELGRRWEALVSLLIDKGILTMDELEARIRERKRSDEQIANSFGQELS